MATSNDIEELLVRLREDDDLSARVQAANVIERLLVLVQDAYEEGRALQNLSINTREGTEDAND